MSKPLPVLSKSRIARRGVSVAPQRTGERALLFGLVVVLGCGFGVQYAMARLMGIEHVDPFGSLLSIHLVLGAVFAAILVAAGQTFRPTWRQAGFFVTVAGFGNVGQLGIEIVAARHVPAGELTLIISLFPVIVLTFACLLRSESLTLRKAAGIGVGTAASSAILLPQALQGDADVFWVAVTFLAPTSQAVGTIIMARYWPRGLSPLQVAAANLVAGAALLLPPVLISGQGLGMDGRWSPGDLAMAVFAATVAMEFYLFALLTRRGGAVLASCADFIAVGAGLALGFILFAEVPSLWMAAAAGLCLVALKLAAEPS